MGREEDPARSKAASSPTTPQGVAAQSVTPQRLPADPTGATAVDGSGPSPTEEFLGTLERVDGVPREQIRFGERPSGRPEPWRTPLERATQAPIFPPVDPGYDAWLHATLADIAEHFALAFLRDDYNAADGRERSLETARILRATALALATSDDEWLREAGDEARRFLQRQPGKKHRIPTLLYASVSERSFEPPFDLAWADLVSTSSDARIAIRETVAKRLWGFRNPTAESPWLQRAAEEIAMWFMASLRAHPTVLGDCSQPDNEHAVVDAFREALPNAPRFGANHSAAEQAGASTSLPRGSNLERVQREIEAIHDFAEQLVRLGLRRLGYPEGKARNFFSSVDKSSKKQAAT
jgi:hypothetical protein